MHWNIIHCCYRCSGFVLFVVIFWMLQFVLPLVLFFLLSDDDHTVCGWKRSFTFIKVWSLILQLLLLQASQPLFQNLNFFYCFPSSRSKFYLKLLPISWWFAIYWVNIQREMEPLSNQPKTMSYTILRSCHPIRFGVFAHYNHQPTRSLRKKFSKLTWPQQKVSLLISMMG